MGQAWGMIACFLAAGLVGTALGAAAGVHTVRAEDRRKREARSAAAEAFRDAVLIHEEQTAVRERDARFAASVERRRATGARSWGGR